MINRRSFFRGIVGATAAAGVAEAIPVKPKVSRSMQYIMRDRALASFKDMAEALERERIRKLTFTTVEMAPNRFKRDGWEYMWTGYKENSVSLDIVGQWVAGLLPGEDPERAIPSEYHHRPGDWYAGACTTGAVSSIRRGDCFDIGVYYGHKHLDLYSSEADKNSEKDWALEKLIRFVDAKGKPSPMCCLCRKDVLPGEALAHIESNWYTQPWSWFQNIHQSCVDAKT